MLGKSCFQRMARCLLCQQAMNTPLVLICDDDVVLARALQRDAERRGLRTVVETEGRVHQRAREHRPEVILLDVHQKGVDGRDQLAALKKDPATRECEVVVISGALERCVEAECLVLGAAAFERKPFRRALMDDVRNLAWERRQAPSFPGWLRFGSVS